MPPHADPRYSATDFKTTQFTTAEEKAAIVNGTIRFLRAGTPLTMFTERLYRANSLHFGHIAHYDRHGFHAEWFANAASRLQFALRIAEGHPWTFGPDWLDVGGALRRWLNTSDLIETYVLAAKREKNSTLVAAATAALDALGDDVRADVLARYGLVPRYVAPADEPEPVSRPTPTQGDLFATFESDSALAASTDTAA